MSQEDLLGDLGLAMVDVGDSGVIANLMEVGIVTSLYFLYFLILPRVCTLSSNSSSICSL